MQRHVGLPAQVRRIQSCPHRERRDATAQLENRCHLKEVDSTGSIVFLKREGSADAGKPVINQKSVFWKLLMKLVYHVLRPTHFPGTGKGHCHRDPDIAGGGHGKSSRGLLL